MQKRYLLLITLLLSLLLHLIFFVSFTSFAFKNIHHLFFGSKKPPAALDVKEKETMVMFDTREPKQPHITPPSTPQAIKKMPPPEPLAEQTALYPKKSDSGSLIVVENPELLGAEKASSETPKTNVVSQTAKNIQALPIKTNLKTKKASTSTKKLFAKKSEIKVLLPELSSPEEIHQKETDTTIATKEKPIDPAILKKFALANLLKSKTNLVQENSDSAVNNPQALTQNNTSGKKSGILSLGRCLLDDEKGNSSMYRAGNKEGFPSLEEMKYICYEKQIYDQINSSIQILFRGRDLNPIGPCGFDLVINEQGEINHLVVLQTSGDPRFDSLTLQAVKSAAPFPAIPKHFGVKLYRPKGIRFITNGYQ